jgi:hypothetical protein
MGALPIDPNELRSLAGATEAEWAIAWPRIEPKFPLNCSGRKNPKLEIHRDKALDLYAKRALGARTANALRDAERAHQSQSQSQSLEPSQKQSQAKTKAVSVSPTEVDSPEMRVFEFWRTTYGHPRAKLDAKRRKVLREAMKGYSESDLCLAIGGYRNSAHHMGRNDRNTVYDDIEIFLRDAKHIDAGIKFAESPQRADLSAQTKRIIDQTADWVPPEMR